jgi:hypothetical protein
LARGSQELNADFAKENIVLRREGWCMARFPNAKRSTLPVGVEVYETLILG